MRYGSEQPAAPYQSLPAYLGCALPSELVREAPGVVGSGGDDVRSHRFTVGGRECLEVERRFGDGTGTQITGTRVYVPARRAMYIVTLTSYSMSRQDPDPIVRSIRVA